MVEQCNNRVYNKPIYSGHQSNTKAAQPGIDKIQTAISFVSKAEQSSTLQIQDNSVKNTRSVDNINNIDPTKIYNFIAFLQILTESLDEDYRSQLCLSKNITKVANIIENVLQIGKEKLPDVSSISSYKLKIILTQLQEYIDNQSFIELIQYIMKDADKDELSILSDKNNFSQVSSIIQKIVIPSKDNINKKELADNFFNNESFEKKHKINIELKKYLFNHEYNKLINNIFPYLDHAAFSILNSTRNSQQNLSLIQKTLSPHLECNDALSPKQLLSIFLQKPDYTRKQIGYILSNHFFKHDFKYLLSSSIITNLDEKSHSILAEATDFVIILKKLRSLLTPYEFKATFQELNHLYSNRTTTDQKTICNALQEFLHSTDK